MVCSGHSRNRRRATKRIRRHFARRLASSPSRSASESVSLHVVGFSNDLCETAYLRSPLVSMRHPFSWSPPFYRIQLYPRGRNPSARACWSFPLPVWLRRFYRNQSSALKTFLLILPPDKLHVFSKKNNFHQCPIDCRSSVGLSIGLP